MWTVDECLSRAKRKAQWPDSGKLTDDQCLEVMTEELWTFVSPLVRGVSEAYWIKRYTTPLTAGLSTYRIPSRCTAGTVFDVGIQDAAGNQWRLNKIQTADTWGVVRPNATGIPSAYAIEGDQVYLYPTPSSGYTLLIRYERRPSSLVVAQSCASVTANNGTSLDGSVGLGSGTYDIQQSAPNFDALYDDVAFTVSGNTYTPDVPQSFTGVVAGDYICPAGYTCVVPVPDVFFSILADRTAAEMLDEAGDAAGSANIRAQLERKLSGVMDSLAPRAEASAPAIFNRWSPLRGG